MLNPLSPSKLNKSPALQPRRGLDRGDVDFLHVHHRIESALRFIATGGKRVGQHARRDLPGNSPLIFAPPALALLSAITDDCVRVTVGLFLIFGSEFIGRLWDTTRQPTDLLFYF